MRKILFLFSILVIVTSSGHAQLYGENFVYSFNTGISEPIGPETFNFAYDLGLNLGVGIGYMTNHSILYSLNVNYNTFSKKLGQIDYYNYYREIYMKSGKPRIFSYQINGRYFYQNPYRNKISVYNLVGIGRVKLSIYDLESISDMNFNDNGFLLSLGGGINVKNNSKIDFLAELRYDMCFTSEHTRFININLGLAFW